MSDHIVRKFQEQLDQLNQTIARMGMLAEDQFSAAVRASVQRDDTLAESTIAADVEIDHLDFHVAEGAVKLLALRQPMGLDLRDTLAAIRISSDLERIGDLAKNLAKRSRVVNQAPPVAPLQGFERMGRLVSRQLKSVVDAYIERDGKVALEVWRRDREVDDYWGSLFRELLTYMMEDPRTITICSHLSFMAKNVERVGDHCANIAATTHYLVTGEPIPESRPKGDDAKAVVVESPAHPSTE